MFAAIALRYEGAAFRCLCLTRAVAMSRSLTTAARRRAMRCVLTYMRRNCDEEQQLHLQRQQQQQEAGAAPDDGNDDDDDDDDVNSQSYKRFLCQDLLCGTVTSLCSRCDPPVPYSAVAGFVPLLRAILRRHSKAAGFDANLREAVYEALDSVFNLCGSVNKTVINPQPASASVCNADATAHLQDGAALDAEDALCMDDIRDFALSPEFNHIFLAMQDETTLWSHGPYPPLNLLYKLAAVLGADTLRRVFTPARLAAVRRFSSSPHIAHWPLWQQLLPLTGLLARLAEVFPAFAQRIVVVGDRGHDDNNDDDDDDVGGDYGDDRRARGLRFVLEQTAARFESVRLRDPDISNFSFYKSWNHERMRLQDDVVRLLERVLSPAADASAQDSAAVAAAGGAAAADSPAAAADPLAVQHLIGSGAVHCCVALLRAAALWVSRSPSTDRSGRGDQEGRDAAAEPGARAVARLLRLLGAMLLASFQAAGASGADTAAGPDASVPAAAAVAPDGDGDTTPHKPPQNAFIACFARARGSQALDLLLYAECTQADDSPARAELARLCALLAGAGARSDASGPAAAPATDTERVRQTVSDVRAFAEPYGGDWQTAFDNYITFYLRNCGYPPAQPLNIQQVIAYSRDLNGSCSNHSSNNSGGSGSAPASVWSAPAPSPPSALALALLQARSRERVHALARDPGGTKAARGDGGAAPRLRQSMWLYNTVTRARDVSTLVIELDDARVPSHAAHFRAAARTGALGLFVHRCFVPAACRAAAALPFVTLFRLERLNSPCATAPLALPAVDVVYGEYAAPATNAAASTNEAYPVGTLLMYPRAAVPATASAGAKPARDTPVFIVFRPCPVTLLLGAVPVGRVRSCVSGHLAAPHDAGDAPFDVTVLKSFADRCAAKTCCKCNSNEWSSFGSATVIKDTV